MTRLTNIAAAAAMTSALALVGSAAVAAPAGASTSMSTHRGSSGCFNYSYADGTTNTTVYYHNKCGHKSQIHIWWKQGNGSDVLHAPKVKAHGKGHVKDYGPIKSIDGDS